MVAGIRALSFSRYEGRGVRTGIGPRAAANAVIAAHVRVVRAPELSGSRNWEIQWY